MKKKILFPAYFEALTCDAYWSVVIKRGWLFPKIKRNYPGEISKICNLLFPNTNK